MFKGSKNVSKRPEVREKLKRNHWSKNPKYVKKIKKIISDFQKGRKAWNKGKTNQFKGKTYEEIYGKEKAIELKELRKISMSRPKTDIEKKKMSMAKKGKYIGKNNPAYIDGRSGKPYGHEFTKELKTKIRKRDGFACKICNKNGYSVHHIDYNKLNNKEDNLITLCRHCHGLTGFNRDKWIKYFRK